MSRNVTGIINIVLTNDPIFTRIINLENESLDIY